MKLAKVVLTAAVVIFSASMASAKCANLYTNGGNSLLGVNTVAPSSVKTTQTAATVKTTTSTGVQ
ncbi:hypothetical protein D3C87_112100 [compost metagenome]